MDFRALLRALMEQYGQQRQQPGAELAGALGAQPGGDLASAIGGLRQMGAQRGPAQLVSRQAGPMPMEQLDRQRAYEMAAANFADQTQGMPMDQLQDIFNRRQETAQLGARHRVRGGRMMESFR